MNLKNKTDIFLIIMIVFLIGLIFIVRDYKENGKSSPNEIIFENNINNDESIDSDDIVIYNTENRMSYDRIDFTDEDVNRADFINNCINANSNIDSEIREILYTYNNFFRDFKFDRDIISNSCNELRRIYIDYIVKSDKKIYGTFYVDSTIKIYTSNIGDRLSYIVGHEGFHAISNYESKKSIGVYDYNRNIGRALNEGITQLLTEEYFGDEIEKSYYNEVLIIKMLLEIIDKNKLMKAYMNGNIDILIDEIMDIDSSITKSRIEAFIKMVDDSKKNLDNIIGEINWLYNLKFGESFYNDMLMSAYGIKFLKSYKADNIGDVVKVEVVKYYFDTSLISINSNAIITIWNVVEIGKDGKVKAIATNEIIDEN